MFRALGQPIRLALVEQLRRGERCVCDLAEAVGAERSNVSRHLSVLLHAGVVSAARRGVQIVYSLRLGCVADLLDCLEGGAACSGQLGAGCCPATGGTP